MINAKPEMRINGIDLILDQESTNERWKAMHDGKQVAEIRLVAGELGVQYPVGAGGDIHQAMVVASVNTFDCDRRREEHLVICVRKIRERMVNDGSLQFERCATSDMEGKTIKGINSSKLDDILMITTTDGFFCSLDIQGDLEESWFSEQSGMTTELLDYSRSFDKGVLELLFGTVQACKLIDEATAIDAGERIAQEAERRERFISEMKELEPRLYEMYLDQVSEEADESVEAD